jgi:hypothetical protein
MVTTVETDIDTTETSTETETSEPVNEKEFEKSINDFLEGGLPLGDAGEEETTEEVETETEAETTEEVTEEPAKNSEWELETNVEGNIEKFNLKDETQKAKLIEYAQKGRHYEKVRQEQNEKEKLINSNAQGMAMNYLQLITKGDIPLAEPIQNSLAEGNGIPLLDEDGKTLIGLEYSDSREYAKAKAKYDRTLRALNEYQSLTQQNLGSWQNAKGKFATNHPDVNVSEFIEKSVDPYYNALISFGTKAIPEDFFEVIYKGKMYQTLVKAEVDKALKNYVKKPVTKAKSPTGKPLGSDKEQDRMINSALNNIPETTTKGIRFR